MQELDLDILTKEQQKIIHLSLQKVKQLFSQQKLPHHNFNHTMDVVITLQEILLGKKITQKEYYCGLLAAIYHDVGYVMLLFPKDKILSSAALLATVHVERSKRYVKETLIETNVATLIEYTNTVSLIKKNNNSLGGLLRAADYIGSFSKKNVPKAHEALYEEFVINGMNKKFGYTSKEDITKKFPEYYKKQVEPLLGPAIKYLEKTEKGRKRIEKLQQFILFCTQAI